MTIHLQTATLANGLQVILRPSSAAPVASFWLFYRVGSRNETPGLTGVSHWVEHMLFKGTEQFPRGAFDKAVARAGGVFNGMTWQDWTTYFETFPSDRIELALQVESDRMANALFDPEETEAERTVILSEREGSENNFFYRLQEELQAAAYTVHSYRQPVIGWKPDLLTMTRADSIRHYRTFYTPNNAVAVVTGDFEPGSNAGPIERYFGALPAGPKLPPCAATNPTQQAERRVIMRGDDPTCYYLQAFQGLCQPPTRFHSAGGAGFGLGWRQGDGHLRRRRQQPQQPSLPGARGNGTGRGGELQLRPQHRSGHLLFSATLAPDVEHAQVEAVIWRELEEVQANGVTAAELEKAIKQTKAQFAYSNESVTYQAYWLGFSAVVADLAWLDGWLTRLAAVTSEDVQRVAADLFHAEPADGRLVFASMRSGSRPWR